MHTPSSPSPFSSSTPSSSTRRRRWLPDSPRRRAAALALVTAAVTALVVAAPDLSSRQVVGAVLTPSAGDGDGGAIPHGGLPVDSRETAVAALDDDLLAAVRAAAADAAVDGIEVRITSGWRSRGYQQRLLDRAERTYGSLEEARRWVATPDTSSHVTGDAVDVGPTDAAYWMAEHGSRYGLCQVYANEIWHYELLTRPGGTCPEARPDSAS